MNAGDSDIVERLDLVAHQLRGNNGFFGDGNVAGSGRDDGDDALVALFVALPASTSARRVVAAKGDAAGEGVVFGFRDLSGNGLELLLSGARGEDVGVGVTGGESREDFGYLSGGFALTEDDFGHSVAQGAVMIEFGEAQVFKRKMAEASKGFVGGELLGSYFLEELAKNRGVH